jgi:ParB family chromosome partitioning protein
MALGKGLGSLIPSKEDASVYKDPQASQTKVAVKGQIREVSPKDITVNPHQPRKNFNPGELDDLMNSIKIHGIISPLVVTEKNGVYELIAGERRLRSAKTLGLPTVPVIVREAQEQEKLEIALIENVQRKQLNALEEAFSYERLLNEFSLTQEEVAQRVGKSRSSVANTLRILELPAEVRQAIMDEKITEGHARAIASLPSQEAQLVLLKKIIENKISVRDTEGEVRKVKGFTKKTLDPVVVEYEEKLRDALGTQVIIKKKGQKGVITIPFSTLADFKDITDTLLH